MRASPRVVARVLAGNGLLRQASRMTKFEPFSANSICLRMKLALTALMETSRSCLISVFKGMK